MLSEEQKKYLKKIYYDPKHEASFGGIDVLYRFVKKEGVYNIDKAEIKRWLQSNENYSTHVGKNKAKHWYSMTVPHPGYLYELDTAYFDVGDKQFKHFLVMIDAFSRKGAARVLKDVRAITVRKAVEEMLDELGPVNIMRSDRGKEFKNKTMGALLKRKNIKQIFSFLPHKSAMAERFIRTLKSKLYKTLQSTGRTDWWEFVPDIVKGYNNKFHRMLGMSPNQVNASNVPQLWYKFKLRHMKNIAPYSKYKYNINDGVRIAQSRSPMEKAHNETNSIQVYFVTYRYSRAHVHRYKLKDMNNSALEGTFTTNQLELTFVDEETEWRVEKVLHYAWLGNGRKKERYAFVKWFGLPNRFNTYTLARNLVNLSDA